jgi:hypothetical protein
MSISWDGVAGYRNPSRLVDMFKLAVTTSLCHLVPAVGLNQLEYVAYLH